jgi:cell division septation protein DedD
MSQEMTLPFRPILRGPTPVRRGWPRERARPGVAVVLQNGTGDLYEEWPGQPQLSYWENQGARFKQLWLVDIDPHLLRYAFEPYCADIVHRFYYDIQLTCRVQRPSQVVQDGVDDALRAIRVPLDQTIGDISRRYDRDDARRVLEAVDRAFPGRTLELDNGLVVYDLEFDFRADAGYIKVVTQTSDIVDDGTIQRKREAEERARVEHELSLRKLRVDAMLEVLDGAGDVIPVGLLRLFALQLGEHKEDIGEVIAAISRQHQAKMHYAVEAFRTLVQSGQLEGYEMKDAREAVLRVLDGISKVPAVQAPAPKAVSGSSSSPAPVPPPAPEPPSPPAPPPAPATGDDQVAPSDPVPEPAIEPRSRMTLLDADEGGG